MNRYVLALALTTLAYLGMTTSSARGEFRLDADSEPAETIQTLTVRIDVGAPGTELDEPVALDLGLGFPFWLQPVGREEPETVPFGAVPQQTTAGASVPAGSGATFTFCVDDEAGQDRLRRTSQMLAGVQVSDVARIGFASQGASNWTLAGYEIEINGRSFASNNAVNVRAQDAQDSARGELAELRLAIAPLESERNDLVALAEAELATEEDRARLAAVEAELMPLAAQRQRLEAQIAGRCAWFEEPGFRSPWRGDAAIRSARVTLVTSQHAGADTQNYVYFRTGGHKYVLNRDAEPLSGMLGSQQFDLDLLAGPLTAADLRGYAVGMLGHGQPYGEAPDRWHPERILVELDGRIVYDSDASRIDHDSLQAIRLIPPAHLDERGEIVANVPTAREAFVWEAGQGAGLDLVEGGALPLPDADDPMFPEAEPGLDQAGLDAGYPDEWDAGFDGSGGLFPPEFPPFPGETDWFFPGGGWGPDAGWPGAGGFADWWPGWDPAWGDRPDWLDFVFNWLLPDLEPLPDGADPPPAGEPFQVESVRIAGGWRYGDTFTIDWTVSGDEGQIDHFQVQLLPVYPEQENPFGMALVNDPAPAGARTLSVELPPVMIADPIYYLAPVVTAVPSDPEGTEHERIGPARPLFPAGTNPFHQPELANSYVCTFIPPGVIVDTVSFGGEPGGAGRAVWAAGEVESHNAILFDNATPAWNIGVRPEPGDDTIRLHLVQEAFTGRHRVVAHVGFLNGPGASNHVQVEMHCSLEPVTDDPLAPAPIHYDVTLPPLDLPVGEDAAPMQRLEQVVDQADLGWGGNCLLSIQLVVRGGAVDPVHPPALVGVRLVPE